MYCGEDAKPLEGYYVRANLGMLGLRALLHLDELPVIGTDGRRWGTAKWLKVAE